MTHSFAILSISVAVLLCVPGCAEPGTSGAVARCLVDTECAGSAFCHPTQHTCVLPDDYVDAMPPAVPDASPPMPMPMPMPMPPRMDMTMPAAMDAAPVSEDAAVETDVSAADASSHDARGSTLIDSTSMPSDSTLNGGDARRDAPSQPRNDSGHADAIASDANTGIMSDM